MIKTLVKLKILKFILIGGGSTAYAFKRYCDKKNEVWFHDKCASSTFSNL